MCVAAPRLPTSDSVAEGDAWTLATGLPPGVADSTASPFRMISPDVGAGIDAGSLKLASSIARSLHASSARAVTGSASALVTSSEMATAPVRCSPSQATVAAGRG